MPNGLFGKAASSLMGDIAGTAHRLMGGQNSVSSNVGYAAILTRINAFNQSSETLAVKKERFLGYFLESVIPLDITGCVDLYNKYKEDKAKPENEQRYTFIYKENPETGLIGSIKIYFGLVMVGGTRTQREFLSVLKQHVLE